MGLNHELAEEYALKALHFIGSEEDRLERFMALSGLDPDTMREAATNESFLAAILEYLMGDESLLLVFTSDIGAPPESVKAAWASLAGNSYEV